MIYSNVLLEVLIWKWALARGERSYWYRGEVRRKFGQFKSFGVVSFIKRTGMFGGVTDRNSVDKQLDIPLFAVRRSFQWTNHLHEVKR